MGGEWRTATVLELQRAGVLLVEDGNHGEYRPRPDEFVDVGVAFIRAADMDGGTVRVQTASKINERARQRITKGIGAPGDILLSHKGTVGKVALVPDDTPPFVCSPQTTFWRTLKPDMLDRRYLYVFLRSPGFHDQLAGRSGETDMAPYVSLTSQRGLSVAVPPIHVQRAIGRIVGALDDKIELNRRMNETLEAMARALFKSRFVDFDPVRGSGHDPYLRDTIDEGGSGDAIPTGWRREPLLHHARLISGGTPKTGIGEYWNGDIQWASAKDVSQCTDPFLIFTERTITERGLLESATRLVPELSTVVVARGATIGRFCLLGRDMAMNQTCYALNSGTGRPFWLATAFANLVDGLVHAAHGSVFDTITTRTLESASVIVAPDEIMDEFEANVAPVYYRILINCEQSQTLGEIRDLLLPKLISGELRVKDAEKFIERAA